MKTIADNTAITVTTSVTGPTSSAHLTGDSKRIKISKEIRCYPRVVAYLKSKARNNQKTGKTYTKALIKFNRFLGCQYPSFDVESIILALESKEKVVIHDVYCLLDQFVAYMMVKILLPLQSNHVYQQFVATLAITILISLSRN